MLISRGWETKVYRQIRSEEQSGVEGPTALPARLLFINRGFTGVSRWFERERTNQHPELYGQTDAVTVYPWQGRDKNRPGASGVIRSVNEALLAAQRGVTAIEALFYEAGFDEKGPGVRSSLKQPGAAASHVLLPSLPCLGFDRYRKLPQGRSSSHPPPAFPPEASGAELYLVIDRVQDPSNRYHGPHSGGSRRPWVLCLKGTADPLIPRHYVGVFRRGAVFRIPISFYDSTSTSWRSCPHGVPLNRRRCRRPPIPFSGRLQRLRR